MRMKRGCGPVMGVLLIAELAVSGTAAAQRPQVGAKLGINVSQVDGVSDFYAIELRPASPIDSSAGAGLIAGGFVVVPLKGRLSLQGDLLFSRRRHSVDVPPTALCPGCSLHATFIRDSVDAAVLPRLDWATTPAVRLYLMAGPELSFNTGASVESGGQTGKPQNIYSATTLPYGTAELLKSQASIVIGGGISHRRLLCEVRFSHGLQPIFKDRADLLDALVQLGGYRPTLEQYYLPPVASFLERAKRNDVSVLFGLGF